MLETTVLMTTNGWQAVTYKALPEVGENLQLKVKTYKHSRGGLVTSTSVSKVDGMWETHRAFHDFNKYTAVTHLRCTERAVRELHNKTIDNLEPILEEIRTHYASLKGKS